jgi:hypothetical protein
MRLHPAVRTGLDRRLDELGRKSRIFGDELLSSAKSVQVGF